MAQQSLHFHNLDFDCRTTYPLGSAVQRRLVCPSAVLQIYTERKHTQCAVLRDLLLEAMDNAVSVYGSILLWWNRKDAMGLGRSAATNSKLGSRQHAGARRTL